ncbi:hypothetical protein [Bombiscardovia coagulans]|uniref:ABC transporter permease n=1 Tax=Bombiscardovia coagulans TaxID=686666 RepID=A0A261EQ03_9BIFI|nr:hypothetical protein [Bombiscardovia coagulans]OZG48766.1 hypothetical protein BOCO_1253 [Bombiscardovia coagulans]
MKVDSILSEAWRDISSGTNRTILWLLTFLFVAIGTLGLDLSTIFALQSQAKTWVTSGAAINLVQSEGKINPTSCMSLSRTTISGAHKQTSTSQSKIPVGKGPISASGALQTGPSIILTAMPSSPLDSFNVTPSLASVLQLTASVESKTGVWISSQLAQTLHVRPGDTLETDHGPMSIAAVFSWQQDGRDQRIAYAILNPSASQEPFDECWATIVPSNAKASELLTATAISTPGTLNPLQIKQINNSLGRTFNGWEQYQKRASKYITIVLPFAALLIGFISVRIRRIEIADDLHCGISRSNLWAINALEALSWSLPAVLFSSAALFLMVRTVRNQSDAMQLCSVELPALLAALVLSQVGIVMALVSIKADHLFRYFKERR